MSAPHGLDPRFLGTVTTGLIYFSSMAKDPTNKQLYDLVSKRFDSVDKKFDLIERRFEMVEKRFDIIEKRFETVFSHLQSIRSDLRELRDGQKQHEKRLDGIEEMLGAVSRAVDKDAVMIIEYGRRITRLERSRS